MRLWNSVGAEASTSRISPYGTRPVLMSAWKPLQMPSARPSRFLSSSMTASRTMGALMMAAMNLPEPSGSSPAEKPPGIMRICEREMASARALSDSPSPAASRLRSTRISGSAPARRNARAVSYSQLLPGKTGMITRGLATRALGLRPERTAKLIGAGVPCGSLALVGKTDSSTPSCAARRSATETDAPGQAILASALVWPSTRCGSEPRSAAQATSSTTEP